MKLKGLRWFVVVFVFLAIVIAYVERMSLSTLWPFIAGDLYPEKTDQELKEIFSVISVFFVFATSFGYIIAGKILDWVGTRFRFYIHYCY